MSNGQYDTIAGLVASLKRGTLNRREFAKRAAAVGLSAGLISQVLNVQAQAQESTPEGPQTRSEIGALDVEHNTDTSGGVIKLYSSWPLTGATEQLGGDAVEAMKLAFADFGNAAGGFAIEYEALDDGILANNGSWDAGVETDNATRAVNDPDCMVYMGTYNSGAAQISIPITNQAGLGQISHANTYPGLTKVTEGITLEGEPEIFYPTGTRNYCRVIPTDDLQGSAAARWAYNDNGRRKAYILHDNQPYGRGVALVFQMEFEALGGEVLGFEGFDANAPDYQSLMASIADTGPDIVYLGAIVNLNASKLLVDMRDFMPVDDVTFLGPDGLFNQAFIDGAGDAAEGAWITFGGIPANFLEGAGADYAAAMEAVLGHTPDAYAMYAYETAVVVLQAIDRAGAKDRAAIMAALMGTKDFRSLLGHTWSFNEEGDSTVQKMGLNQVQGGEIVYLQLIA